MLEEQIKICTRFGSALFIPEPLQKVGIALKTLGAQPLNAIRHPIEAGTCGWYIWSGEYSSDPEFFQTLHVAHLNDYCPELIKYLALEPGWGVQLAPNCEDVWFDEKFLSV